MTDSLRLELTGSFSIDAAAGDGKPRRTITGVALEYGVAVVDMWGTKARFEAGSLPLDGPAPKLIAMAHHSAGGVPIGVVTERVQDGNKVLFAARVSETVAGTESLALAADGVLDQVSVTATPTQYRYEGDTLVVESATWSELALVPAGAFGEKASVTSVAAAAPTTPPIPNKETTTVENITTPEVVEAAQPQATIPTNPLVIAAAAPSVPKIDAATYLSHVATGRKHPAVEAAQQGMGDTPGLLPEPLVGEVYGQLDQSRPFVASIGTLAHPAAATWYRRKITQHTEVGRQESEFDALASRKLVVQKLLVESNTFGGTIDISEQDIDFSDPAALNLTLNDMSAVYAETTEAWACELLADGATETLAIANFLDADELLDGLIDASTQVAGAIKKLPRTLWVSLDRWAVLGKAKDADGKRMMPIVNPTNAAGNFDPGQFRTNVGSFTVVCSPYFDAGTMILGHSQGIELYEQRKGSIGINRPEELAYRLAFRGYFAGKVIDEGAFVKFVQD